MTQFGEIQPSVIAQATVGCTVSAIIYIPSSCSTRTIEHLSSVLSSPSLDEFEFIIVDDGQPTEFCEQFVNSISTNLLTYLRFVQPVDIPAVGVNYGLLYSRSREVIIVVADELDWTAESLLRLVQVHRLGISSSVILEGLRFSDSLSFEKLPVSFPTHKTMLICDREIFERTGLFDPHLLLRPLWLWDWLLRSASQGIHLLGLAIYGGKTCTSEEFADVQYSVARHYMTLSRQAFLLPSVIEKYDFLDPERFVRSLQLQVDWQRIEQHIYKPYLEQHSTFGFNTLALDNHTADYDNANGIQDFFRILPLRPRVALITNRYTALAREWTDALDQHLNALVVLYDEALAARIDPVLVDIVIVLDEISPRFLTKMVQLAYHTCVIAMLSSSGSFPLADQKNLLSESCDLIFVPAARYDEFQNICNAVVYRWPMNAREIEHTLPNDNVKIIAYSVTPNEITDHISDLIFASRDMSVLMLAYELRNTILIVGNDYLEALGYDDRCLLEAVLYDQNSVFIAPEDIPADLSQVRAAFLVEQLEAIGSKSESSTTARSLQLTNMALLADIHRLTRLAPSRTTKGAFGSSVIVFLNSPLFAGSEVYGMLLAHGLSRLGILTQVVVPTQAVYHVNEDEKGEKIDKWLEEHGMAKATRLAYGLDSSAFFKTVDDLKPEISRIEDWLSSQSSDLLVGSGPISELILAQLQPHQFRVIAQMQLFGYPANRMTAIAGQTTALICDSHWSVSQWSQFVPPPVQFVPTAVEPEMFNLTSPAYQVADGTVRIAIGGTICERKRQLEGFLACEALYKEGYDIEIHYYGYELYQDREYIQKLKDIISRSDFKDKVFFHGLVPMPELIVNNHIFLLTSINESMPQTLLYAMAGGMLCVAAPAGGVEEAVIDGQTGYLAKGFIVSDIVEGLRRALDRNAEWPEIVQQSRMHIRKKYSEQFAMNQFLSSVRRGAAIQLSPGVLLTRAINRNRIEPNYSVAPLSVAPLTGLARIRNTGKNIVFKLPEPIKLLILNTYVRFLRQPLNRILMGRWISPDAQ